MTDLVSIPPPPSSPAGSKITTPGFWPDIDVNKVRAQINLGGEIPHERLLEALASGAIDVVSELAEWQAGQEADGFASLILVPPVVDFEGVKAKERLFVTAVSAYAAARLADRNPDLTATRDGRERAEERICTADDFRRDAVHAIRQIQGKARTDAELI